MVEALQFTDLSCSSVTATLAVLRPKVETALRAMTAIRTEMAGLLIGSGISLVWGKFPLTAFSERCGRARNYKKVLK